MSLGGSRELSSLDGASGWINSAPLAAAALRGRVVLVDFWTYSCINWIRTLPYVRAWSAKYAAHGLTVVGVHTPEFRFEHDPDRVRRATAEMAVEYPVVLDPDYAIWTAFANNYWPALYFVDVEGRVRDHRFGEGDYEGSERLIRQLLAEAGSSVEIGEISVEPAGIEAAADWNSLKSPETYLGSNRSENLVSTDRVTSDGRRFFEAPAQLSLNHWALSGAWTIEGERAVLNEAVGRIAFQFEARDLHLVLGPPAEGTSARFRVRLDGQPPGASHGLDVDAEGNGSVSWPRLYQLIRQGGPVVERTFEIEFLDPGVQAYVFTFG